MLPMEKSVTFTGACANVDYTIDKSLVCLQNLKKDVMLECLITHSTVCFILTALALTWSRMVY